MLAQANSSLSHLTACLALYHVLHTRNLRFFRKALRDCHHLDRTLQSIDITRPAENEAAEAYWGSLSALLPSTSSIEGSLEGTKWIEWLSSESKRRLASGLMVRIVVRVWLQRRHR